MLANTLDPVGDDGPGGATAPNVPSAPYGWSAPRAAFVACSRSTPSSPPPDDDDGRDRPHGAQRLTPGSSPGDFDSFGWLR